VNSVTTRHRHCLHKKKTANLSCFQKSAYYAGIKIFRNLLCKLLMNEKGFKTAITHIFYSVDEYLLSKK
jgi:hypothetical protein